MKHQSKLGDIKIPYLNDFLKKRGFVQNKIISSWNSLIGEFKNYASPIRIKFPKNKFDEGTLIVNVKSGIGPEIEMKSSDIINKIKIQNGNFADDHKLKNKLVKETKTDIRYVTKIKEIKNDNLANALISIGNYINKWHIEVQTLGAIN